MYFQRLNCLTTGRYASLFFRTSKIFFGEEHYGHLLVPGQVEHFTFSTSLPYPTIFLVLKMLSAYIQEHSRIL